MRFCSRHGNGLRLPFLAGITLEAIAGHNTGVYVGASQVDYTSLLHKDAQDIPVYQSTGTSANILSNRISYVFNLKGPSWTMDTACSSSLAALHTACQSIRLGEITQAIVGGAHIMLSPDTMVGMSMLRYCSNPWLWWSASSFLFCSADLVADSSAMMGGHTPMIPEQRATAGAKGSYR